MFDYFGPFFTILDLGLATACSHYLCGKEKALFQATESNPAFICSDLWQIFTTLPLNTRLLTTQLWFTTAPPWAPGGLSTFTHRGECQMKLHTNSPNLHFQQVVSDVAVSERSHVLLSLIYNVSLSCVWTSDSSEGEKCGIHLALRSNQLVGQEGICRSWCGGEDSTIKKNTIERILPISTVLW